MLMLLQFAYNEVSYLLIRLLQSFSGFSLATDEMPDEAMAPKHWANSPGAKGREKIMFGMHLTMYAKVSTTTNNATSDTY